MNHLIRSGAASLFVQESRPAPELPTLVFLHDSLGCTGLWRDFPESLARLCHCNLLVYDRQGYGRSEPFGKTERSVAYLQQEADILYDLLQQLDIQDAILFGHSDGGSIALIAAAKYPAGIRAVITEGAHIFVEEITLQGIREAVKLYQSTNLKEKLQRYHGDKTEALFRAWTDTWLRHDYRSWTISHLLPELSCAVLVIQGELDEYGSLAQVEGIITGVSGPAEHLIIPGIGHTPHKEARDIVLERSAAFIKTVR